MSLSGIGQESGQRWIASGAVNRVLRRAQGIE